MRKGIAGAVVAAGVLAAAGVALSQSAPPQSTPPRGFDYWQPDWMVRELWGPGRMPKSMMVRLLRHTTYINLGVPEPYAGAKSTVETNAQTLTAGGALYAKHCVQCHGADGTGGGEGSLALSPSPALLAYMIQRPVAVDEYLLWSIADGGTQFGSEMPAYKDRLSRDEIWRIVAYMRAGFTTKQDARPKPR
jgi:mono/diheme cytochrome c family protein